MIERYDLATCGVGVADGVDEATRRFVVSQMDPFTGARSSTDPDVLVERGSPPAIDELQNPATKVSSRQRRRRAVPTRRRRLVPAAVR